MHKKYFIIWVLFCLIFNACEKVAPGYVISTDDEGLTKIINRNVPNRPDLVVEPKEICNIPYSGFTGLKQGGIRNFIAISNCGYIYVYNQTKMRIDKFDLNGDLILSFGGKGFGPGELGGNNNDVSKIYIQEEKLFVFISPLKKANIYKLDGEFLESVIIRNPEFDINNFILFEHTITPAGNDNFIHFMSYHNNEYWFLKLSIKPTLSIANMQEIVLYEQTKKKNSNLISLTSLKHVYAKSKLYVANNSQDVFEIKVFNELGTLIRVIQKTYIRVRYPKSFMKMVKDNINFKETDFAYMQAIDQIMIDKYDRIWVKCSEDMMKEKYDLTYQIFDSTGIYMNKIKVDTGVGSNGDMCFISGKLVIMGFNKEGPRIYLYDY